MVPPKANKQFVLGLYRVNTLTVINAQVNFTLPSMLMTADRVGIKFSLLQLLVYSNTATAVGQVCIYFKIK